METSIQNMILHIYTIVEADDNYNVSDQRIADI